MSVNITYVGLFGSLGSRLSIVEASPIESVRQPTLCLDGPLISYKDILEQNSPRVKGLGLGFRVRVYGFRS